MNLKNLLRDKLFSLLMPALPKEDLSQWIGLGANISFPEPIRVQLLLAFAKAFGINLAEVELPIGEYPSFQALFTRKLKPAARPLGVGLLHCADAKITQAGKIEASTLFQAKGMPYTVEGLLRSSTMARAFTDGYYITYYLCPADYHRVHFPLTGEVQWSVHIPGSLWPVNDWSIANVESVFEKNERVAWVMQDKEGRKVAMVMVGATNVGNISVSFDSGINTSDHRLERAVREKSYQPGFAVQAGNEAGIFHLGSTVVVLFERGFSFSETGLLALCGQSTFVRSAIRL